MCRESILRLSSYQGGGDVPTIQTAPSGRSVSARRTTRLLLTAALLAAAAGLSAQTEIKLPKNNFTPQQDVEIGMKGAAEIRRQYPIIQNEAIAGYLTTLGERLLAVAPPALKQPVYRYSF